MPWLIQSSRDAAGEGATSYDIVIPEFTTALGFNAAWGLASGAPVTWRLQTPSINTAPAAGGTLSRSAVQTGVLTP